MRINFQRWLSLHVQRHRKTKLLVVENVVQASKNLIDKSAIRPGQMVVTATGLIIPEANHRVTGFIPVTPGQELRYSGADFPQTLGFFSSALDTATVNTLFVVNETTPISVPLGTTHIAVNITGQNTTAFDSTVQLEVGTVATSYEPF